MSFRYSLGSFFSEGHSEERILYSLSSRWPSHAAHATPDSIQITFSFGNRSLRPFTIQSVQCSTLYQVKPSAWTAMNRFEVLNIGSSQLNPEWKPMGGPISSIAA